MRNQNSQYKDIKREKIQITNLEIKTKTKTNKNKKINMNTSS